MICGRRCRCAGRTNSAGGLSCAFRRRTRFWLSLSVSGARLVYTNDAASDGRLQGSGDRLRIPRGKVYTTAVNDEVTPAFTARLPRRSKLSVARCIVVSKRNAPPPDPNTRTHLEWLGFIQPNGLVVSAPALVKAGSDPEPAGTRKGRAGCLAASTRRVLDPRARGRSPYLPDFGRVRR